MVTASSYSIEKEASINLWPRKQEAASPALSGQAQPDTNNSFSFVSNNPNFYYIFKFESECNLYCTSIIYSSLNLRLLSNCQVGIG